ncbi:MAG TPA: FGGY family carbohydrate kinase, partial [Gemmatimonadales bacterium]|nr:FGGY family carbohydrate kinase [Gemmatimonadales bacterium]
MPSILALDEGTTGATALLVRDDGRIIGHGYREFTQHFPEPGRVEHDALEILRVSVEAMREAVERGGERPAALGITNQRETVVLWDRATRRPVAPAIVWQDRRTTARCRELRDAGLEPMLRRKTGLVADPYFSATKLEWLLLDRDLRRRAEAGELAFGTIESWLVACLTGGLHVSDHTNASRTLLYNLATRTWDDDL